MSAERQELKPCPFCGTREIASTPWDGVPWFIRCHNIACDAGPSVGGDSEAEAIEHWNYRPLEDELIAAARSAREDSARLLAKRDAWRELAEHAGSCVDCGGMSVEYCDIGRLLQNAARWLEWGENARGEWKDWSVTVLAYDGSDATVLVDGFEASNTAPAFELVIQYPAASPGSRDTETPNDQ